MSAPAAAPASTSASEGPEEEEAPAAAEEGTYVTDSAARMDHDEKNKLLKCFKLFDKNKDGKIDASELKALLTRVGTQDTRALSEKDAQELIDDFDADGDGSFSIDEICNAWSFITNDGLVEEHLTEQRQAAAAKMRAKNTGNVDAEGRPIAEPATAAK
jgi:hypothetical protein